MNTSNKIVNRYLSLSFIGLMAIASGAQQSQRVSMAFGNTKVLNGSTRSRYYKDYTMKVGAGQTVTVRLNSACKTLYFNFNPPHSDASMYIGSISENEMNIRTVPTDGNYTIRVYQTGNARNTNKAAKFSLTMAVSGKALDPIPDGQDARIIGTQYHASAAVSCAIEYEPARTHCQAFVVRRAAKSATVEFRAGNMKRQVLYMNGMPIAHDSAEKLSWSRIGDSTTLHFGNPASETYHVPDSLVYGD